MNFFCITDTHNPTTNRLLRKACDARKVMYNEVTDDASFQRALKHVKHGDFLYRVLMREDAKMWERQLCLRGASSFYIDLNAMYIDVENVITDTMRLHSEHIPQPLTTIVLSNERKQLRRDADAIGGYPLIAKIVGGSHGVGVVWVSTQETLFSLADVFIKRNILFVLRQYIPNREHIRLIVLGDIVIDSIIYVARKDDFRTNIGKTPLVRIAHPSLEERRTAVRAVRVLGLEFGGVDLIRDKDEKHYVLEVNFPCFFPRCQNMTGTDIAGMMIEYLRKKAERQSRT